MNPNPEFAKAKLTDASRLKDHAYRTAWLLLIIGFALLLFLGAALADYWFVLPLTVRLAAMLVSVGLAGVGIFRLLGMLHRPTTIKEAALDVETQDPNLGCTVSTAAEYLSGERPIRHKYEPELVAALEKQAAVALAKAQLPYWRRALVPGTLAGAALIILLGFLLASAGARTALRRTVTPWSRAAYTQIDVKPGNVEIPVGRDLDITNIFTGRPPKDPRFYWRAEGEPKWHNIALVKGENGAYVQSFKEVAHSMTYRVTGGDATSPEYQVDAYIPPTVKDLRVQLAYPAYTGRAPITQVSPEISIVRGSTATFSLVPSTKLSQARLRFDKASNVDLTLGADQSWTGSLKIAQDADYWIELRDEKGRLGVNDKPYHIKALPDDPPKVEIAEPGQDMRADPTNTIALKISVADDFGVNDIKLVYHRLGGPEQVLPVKRDGQSGQEITATANLQLEKLDLKPYELVAYRVEATDNNSLDGPGVGKSPLYFVEITNEEGASGKPREPGSKVNLLVIQKQIIADTLALTNNATTDQYDELAKRESDAIEFGQMYHESLASGGAPPAAVEMMQSALADMTNATKALTARHRDTALPPEEHALASFYQLLKLLPELGDLPTQPQQANNRTNRPPSKMVNVVLEAIKKQKKEQPDDKEVAELMEQAQQLSMTQNALNQASQGRAKSRASQSSDDRNQSNQQSKQSSQSSQSNQSADSGQAEQGDQPAQGGQGQGGQGQPSSRQTAQKGRQGQQKPSQQAQKGSQEGQKGDQSDQQTAQNENQSLNNSGQNGQGQGAGQQGDQPGQEGQANAEQEPQNSDLPKLAEQQEQLSKEAQALAEKLNRLAGKDTRLGHNLTKSMSNAINRMNNAAQNYRAGNRGGGTANGGEVAYSLNTVVSMLQKILEANKKLADVSNEEYPKEYETAIRDYLKRLSYQE